MGYQAAEGIKMSAYIFVYFTGEEHENGEQIYFSLSRDGLHWNDLNGGKPVLISELGERGVRDPFIVKHPKTGRFYLIATDLCMYTKKDWGRAVHEGSRDMIVWESDDLVTWSKERNVTIGIQNAGCVWAPEAVYDKEREEFMVFFASFTRADGGRPECGKDEPGDKHIIYRSFTKDFKSFTPVERYIEREQSIIDTTIIRDGNIYYRFSKDEVSKKLILEAGESLDREAFTQIESETLSGLYGLEGPECYRLPDGYYCLIADRFAEHKGYMPIVIDDMSHGVMHVLGDDKYDLGSTRKRHGGVMEITDSEYDRLLEEYGLV